MKLDKALDTVLQNDLSDVFDALAKRYRAIAGNGYSTEYDKRIYGDAANFLDQISYAPVIGDCIGVCEDSVRPGGSSFGDNADDFPSLTECTIRDENGFVRYVSINLEDELPPGWRIMDYDWL